MPRKTSCSGMASDSPPGPRSSRATPATTKQFRPMGGVMRQISAIFTTTMPNQMGS